MVELGSREKLRCIFEAGIVQRKENSPDFYREFHSSHEIFSKPGPVAFPKSRHQTFWQTLEASCL